MKNPIDLYLVAGNITVFCGQHRDAFKTDLLQSSLYSHLLAAKSVSNRELVWSAYTQTLGKMAWTQNSNTYKNVDYAPNSLLNIIKSNTQHLISDSERQSLADSFSELAKLPQDSSTLQLLLKKLRANSNNKQEINNQLTPANKTTFNSSMIITIIRENRTIITVLVAFQTTTADELGILDGAPVQPTQDSKNNIMVWSSNLDEANYSLFRQAITEKTKRKIETELVHISSPIPD